MVTYSLQFYNTIHLQQAFQTIYRYRREPREVRTFSIVSLPRGWYLVDTGYLPQKLGKTLLSKDSSQSQLAEKQYLVIQKCT